MGIGEARVSTMRNFDITPRQYDMQMKATRVTKRCPTALSLHTYAAVCVPGGGGV